MYYPIKKKTHVYIMDDNKLDILIQNVKNLNKKIDQIEKDTKKMSEHINFVHTTFGKFYNVLGIN